MKTTTNCFLFHQECKLGGFATVMLIQPANYKTSNRIQKIELLLHTITYEAKKKTATER
jgi:hypothetical protein